MTSKSVEKALDIFREHKGVLRNAQAKKLGIHEMVLSQMVNEVLLVREGKGIYRLADLPPLSNPDFVQVAIKMHTAVICLISSLNFHNLTTEIPNKVYIALPRGTKGTQIDYPPLDIIWPVERIYSAGIEEHDIDGVNVKIYCKEKTVADCFRYSKKVGSSVALEALKDYLRTPNYSLDLLFKYAQINKVEKTISPFIMALI